MAGVFSLVKRPENRRALALLSLVDAELFAQAECWFAGGTAVSLLCGEYRVSRDVDFLCSSRDGYRVLRQRVFERGAPGLFCREVEVLREARADRYGVRFAVKIEGESVKVEIVSEGRIDLSGLDDPALPVARLSNEDLVAEKLLANQDRHLDDGALGRDAFDLILLEHNLGGLPTAAFEKARAAYGPSIDTAWERALCRLQARAQLREHWEDQLAISPEARRLIKDRLAFVPLHEDRG
jgi:hypothetical protein